jgi:Pectate lyase superfamily protein
MLAAVRPVQPTGQRHLIRRSLILIAALAAAGYGAVSLAPTASAGSAAAADPAAIAVHPHVPASPHVAGAPNLGPNVYVFTPSMPQSQIQATVDAIASHQVPDQFGTNRYTLFFEPGTYGTPSDPLIFQVGYYTQVAGLGSSPGDVVINGSVDVYNQCFPSAPGTTNCIALDNFWRSLSNLTIDIAGGSGCQTRTEFWAVSQAAPMRRVDINGGTMSFMDYCSAGPQFASGGFVADSQFTGGTIVNGSQQQFIVRNSNLDGWSNGVWNQVFSGDNGAPAQAFGVPGGAGPYTTLATSPVTQEEPFLYHAADGTYRVFVPAVQHDSAGPTWTNGPTAGGSIPINRFFVASPSTPVGRINGALASGQNLILTPGVYHVSQPIAVPKADTVVLGLGLATLIPDRGNAAMTVANVPGVKLSGVIVDAGPVNSPALMRIGSANGSGAGNPADPTLIQDVYFRIGGAEPGEATNSLTVNSSHVILDNIWAWRADHGAGVGWTDNVADRGLVVNGDDVTAYGIFVEHYQKTQVIWRGQDGTDIFYQNEMPYDPPSQAAWMADAKTDGYPAFEVAANVRTFTGYGLGSYCYFNQGLPIAATQAFQAPSTAPGVRLHDLLTVFLSGSGSINSVIDGVGAAVTSATAGSPSNVVSFP